MTVTNTDICLSRNLSNLATDILLTKVDIIILKNVIHITKLSKHLIGDFKTETRTMQAAALEYGDK